MKRRLLFAPLVAILISFTILQNSGAQDPFGGDGGASDDPFAPGTPQPPATKFDLDFRGISAAEACEFIAAMVTEKEKKPLNIVVSKEASDLVLPDMKLQQITFDQFVTFINELGGSTKTVRYGINESAGIWHFWAEKQSTESDPHHPEDPFSQKEPRSISTSIFPLDGEVEATLGLIEEAIKQTRQSLKLPEPIIKFHEPSETLVVTASQIDLELVQEVINAISLRQRQKNEKSTSTKTTEGLEKVAAENETLKSQLSSMKAEVQALMADMNSRIQLEKVEKAKLEAVIQELERELRKTKDETTGSSGQGGRQ